MMAPFDDGSLIEDDGGLNALLSYASLPDYLSLFQRRLHYIIQFAYCETLLPGEELQLFGHFLH
jgi:hypothetical protein